jgi:hypothetical protein
LLWITFAHPLIVVAGLNKDEGKGQYGHHGYSLHDCCPRSMRQGSDEDRFTFRISG